MANPSPAPGTLQKEKQGQRKVRRPGATDPRAASVGEAWGTLWQQGGREIRGQRRQWGPGLGEQEGEKASLGVRARVDSWLV